MGNFSVMAPREMGPLGSNCGITKMASLSYSELNALRSRNLQRGTYNRE